MCVDDTQTSTQMSMKRLQAYNTILTYNEDKFVAQPITKITASKEKSNTKETSNNLLLTQIKKNLSLTRSISVSMSSIFVKAFTYWMQPSNLRFTNIKEEKPQ